MQQVTEGPMSASSPAAAEKALRESEIRLALASDAANIGIWDWDVSTGHMNYSDRAKAICGFTPDSEVTYEDARRVTHPDDLPRTSERARRSLDPSIRERIPYQYRLLLPDGSIRWVLAHGEATFAEIDGEMRAVRYVGTLQDITERLRLEEADRTAEARVRLAAEAARMAVWEIDLRTNELLPSRELNHLLGFPDGSWPSTEEIRSRYYPGEGERLRSLGAEVLANGGSTVDTEFRYIRCDGAVRWMWLRAEGVPDASGKPARAVGVIMDVTERKQAEVRQHALAELAGRTRELDEPADIAFTAAEILARTLDVSRAGYGTVDPMAETITIERDWNAPGVNSLAGVLHFRDYGSYIEDLKRGETVVVANAELDPRTASTAEALKAISAQAFVNMPVSEQGGLVALLYLNHATVREWTDDELALIREVAERTRQAVARRQAEIELRDLNRELEQRVVGALAERKLWADVFESSAARIAAVDHDLKFLALNSSFIDEFARVFGGVRPQLGDRLPDLVAHMPAEGATALELWTRAATGEEFTVTQDFANPDGERFWFDIRFNRLRNRDGATIGTFQYVVNVTDRIVAERKLTEAQEALRQSQKMDSIGQLTGGVAHDFNNLLTPIVGSLDLLQRRGIGGDRERRLIDGALQSAERARTLVQRLLAFARRQPLQPRSVDLAGLVRNMVDLVASTSGPRVTLNVDVPEDLVPVHADPNQLEMAILNLAVNARDAMPDGGVLTITASPASLNGGEVPNLPPGQYVRLSVADTGVGMDETVLARAAEPFFSTKGIGRGTGLGLSMVHGLAAQLGGALSIQSRRGVGTNVALWLPVASDSPAEKLTDEAVPNAEVVGTVLLVDDEELVRITSADMLAELGYAVVEANSAEAAMELVAGGQAFDLLVTDHLMPGATGAELARNLAGQRPGTPVLIISGYAELESLAPDFPRLTKPFRRDELAAALGRLAPPEDGAD